MKKRILFILICSGHLLSATSLLANDYPISDIPDSLKTNANAIVRDYTVEIIQSDIKSATYKETVVVTVLNKKGETAGHYFTYGDKFKELTSFSGTLRDGSGKIIKKIKKGDLFSTSMTDGGTTADGKVRIIYECQSPTYPYTIEYTTQQKMKNGILAYPPFYPMPGYQASIQNANYKLVVPTDIKVRHKSSYKDNLKEEEIGEQRIYTVSITNLQALDYERNSPKFKELAPVIFFAPSDFCFDSACGNMKDWSNYGSWVYELLKDRDALPTPFIEKLKELIKDAPTDREKTKILYEYLQANTRYISIQLGIGGYRPFEASSVLKTAYGDCKGLSNLMYAMLKAVGIPANYVVINLGDEDKLYDDYPSFNQINHAIAMVPLKNDTIWLECTSQTMPFGYIHDGIAGHDALVITEKGGEIRRLPSYSEKENTEDTKLEISIDENGNMAGNITITGHLNQYDYLAALKRTNDRKKFTEYLHSNIQLAKSEIGNIQIQSEESSRPSAQMTADFRAESFANKTGNRLFIPICPLKKGETNPFSATKRNNDIIFKSGYSDNDTIIINVPTGYVIESLPKEVELKTEFATFKAEAKEEAGKIMYTQNIILYSGTYSKDSYEELKDFYTKMLASTKRKLVLKKAE